MALSNSSHPASSISNTSITIEEIIFSCDVCQAVVSDIYAKKDSNHGFSSGDGDEDDTVVRLWMGDCTHIFCGKHLEGGAVPFHSKSTGPRAQCPVCKVSDGSNHMRDLFAIRGVNPGDYDGVIPHDWLVCPPIKLDAEGDGMDALRFQYNHFVRYSQHVRDAAKSVKTKQRALEAALSKERKQWRKRELGLEKELEEGRVELDVVKNKLKNWDDRKDAIKHYMSIVVEMSRDLAAMRTLLRDLGVDFPMKEYAFLPPNRSAQSLQQSRAGDHGTYGSNGHQKSSSSHKRKLSDYDAYTDPPKEEVYAQRQSEIDRVPAAYSRAPKVLQRPRETGLRSHEPAHHFRPALPIHDASLLSQQAFHKRPQELSRERGAMQDGAQSYRQQQGFDIANSQARQQQFAGYANSSARDSERDLISGIGNTTLSTEASKFHRNDGMKVPFRQFRPPETDVPQTQLPVRIPQREEDRFTLTNQRMSGTHLSSQVRSSRISHFDPSYGTVAQQSGAHAPREMQRSPPPNESQLQESGTQISSFKYQPRSSVRPHLPDPPAASVVSPFFRGNVTSSRGLNTQRQHLDRDWRPDHGLQSRGDTLGRLGTDTRERLEPSSLYTRTSSPSRRETRPFERSSGSQFMPPPSRPRQQLTGSTYIEPSHQNPPYANPAYINDNRSSPVRNACQNQISQRTPLLPPSRPFLRPASRTQGQRISLPPSQSLASSYGRKYDPELSQIRGVKGASVPQYDARSLFSAAGSRRSVRR